MTDDSTPQDDMQDRRGRATVTIFDEPSCPHRNRRASARVEHVPHFYCEDCHRDVPITADDRQELIPPDLAPRITQMVVDDLRAAGWTVEPPTQSLGEIVETVEDWYANRRDSYRAAKNEPCVEHEWPGGGPYTDGPVLCRKCGINLLVLEHQNRDPGQHVLPGGGRCFHPMTDRWTDQDGRRYCLRCRGEI